MATIHSFEDSRSGTRAGSERIVAAWHRFVQADTAGAFYQSWFSVLCEQIEDARCGALLVHAEESGSFAPIAVWPGTAQEMSFLGTVTERALAEQRGIVLPGEEPRSDELHVAYPVQDGPNTRAVIALAVGARPNEAVQQLLRELHWSLGWLHEAFLRARAATVERRLGEIGGLCDAIASSLRDVPLEQALYETANLLARHLDCSRAVIGLVHGARVRVTAYSDAAGLERNTDANALYRAAMEEALDGRATLTFDAEKQLASASAHAELAHAFGAKHLASAPLLLGVSCIGVVLVERHAPKAFQPSQIEWLDALSPMLAGVIQQKRSAELGYVGRMQRDTAAFARMLLGPRHLTWKFVGICALAIVTALGVVDLEYKVRAKTVIEGQVQRTAAVPFQGFVAASFVRAGDVVRQGQVLCVMDDRELKLERDKAASEREQRLRELREAMAQHDLTKIQIVEAQVRQAEAQLGLLDDQLARARIVAPFDGVVISGDLSELIGTPVELGKQLFEIAPLHGYRVILQVDESDIRHIREGQRGKLLVAGIASDPTPFSVSKVTPVSTAKDGANYFRVEAGLDRAPANLRPGMEGIGKVATGERPLWWILCHTFIDWLRLKTWQWLP
jgi:Barrel-sandwich domain of CusB or HlyD membrane-fusion/GAF domain